MKRQPISVLAERIALPLGSLASPQRVAILLAIGEGEACVCHLEAALGWRQAYISQHLMALRRAGILQDRREGRYVYYSLKDAGFLELLRHAAELSGLEPGALETVTNRRKYPSCECPHCSPAIIPITELQKR